MEPETDLEAANRRLLERRRATMAAGPTRAERSVAPVLSVVTTRAETASRDLRECGCERIERDGRRLIRRCGEHELAHQERVARERREQQREDRIANLPDHLRASGFLREHATAKLADFAELIRARAIAWLDGPDDRAGLLIKGPVGTGKTRLAAALAGKFLIDGASVMGASCGDLFGRIRATFRDNSAETEEQLVESLKSVGLLVVDDLGTEGTSSYVVQTLHRVISARNGDWQPTIVTTNLKLEEIRATYGERIASRVECWEQIVVDGADRRKR